MLLDIEIKFSNLTVNRQLDYPTQNKVEITFGEVDCPITVESISMNGISTNIFYNSSYKIANTEIEQHSVHSIERPGVYTLTIDDLYIRSHRSSTWHCSEKPNDFFFTYEFTRSSFVDVYRDRNHTGFEGNFFPCFGCSFTYGAGQADTSAWPYLLAKKTGQNFLNLGIASTGPDGIYHNMSLLHRQFPYDKCVILVPPFERRMVHTKIGDLHMRVCSNVDLDDQQSDFHFYNDPSLREQMGLVRQQILIDVENQYSIDYFQRIIKFCENRQIDLYCTAWTQFEYQYLKQKEGFTLLSAFPHINTFEERADDGQHPHEKHYRLFVDQITNESNFL